MFIKYNILSKRDRSNQNEQEHQYTYTNMMHNLCTEKFLVSSIISILWKTTKKEKR